LNEIPWLNKIIFVWCTERFFITRHPVNLHKFVYILWLFDVGCGIRPLSWARI